MPGVDLLALLGAAQCVQGDGARLQQTLQRARFDLMAVASRRALAGELAAGNAETKALVDANPQMRGWVVVNPYYPERSAEELKRYLGSSKFLGAVLDPYMSGLPLTSASTRELLNAYRRYTKPLLVRCLDADTAGAIESMAPDFNTIKFVAWGGGGHSWQAGLLAAKRCPNVFLEPFSGGAHRGKLEGLMEVLGAHRVLFASSYPDQNPGYALGMLTEARISDADKQMILTNAAVRLFGLRGE